LNTDLFTLVKTAGVAMWIIAFCSVAGLAVAVERTIALWRFGDKAKSLADAVTRALFRGDPADARAQCERSSSPFGDVFLAAIVAASPPSAGPQRSAAPASPEKIAAAAERERQQVNLKLRQNLWILGTIGATAPFIGLFGTVWGIMRAFGRMAQTGQGGFATVSGDISEALIATAGGIAVAIEAVVIYNFFNTHVQRLALQLRLLTEEYLEIAKDVLPRMMTSGATPADTERRG
jgi:biopolymer transport protein ExbB